MKLTKLFFSLSLLVGVLFMSSCGDDDEPMTSGDNPISSFQFTVDAADFQKVAFSNFSQNATTYAWNFGDGNDSAEESPTHTYAAAGDYTVVLTASNAAGTSATSMKDITITDPNTEVDKITGGSTKVWKLSRNITDEEFPLQVGPENRSEIWWALGVNDPIGARPCIMEEEYIFGSDGSFVYDSKGSVFADFGIWNPDVQGACVDDTDGSNMTGPGGEDLSAWGSGSFTFDFDAALRTLTVNGLGAHVGLPKVATNSEVAVPQNSVTYSITSLDTDGPVDKMVLETTIDGGYWQFFLVSYDDPNDEPDLGGAPPSAGFNHVVDGSTVTFTNTSNLADSYSWDFGDTNTSIEESPTHTYAGDGAYTVVLTATNSDGTTTASANIIISANSVFSAETIHGGGSKVWKLNPADGALAVGPGKGSGEWFQTSLDDLTTRDCTFDDTYTFDNMGAFDYNTNGDLWAEAYMGIADAGCVTDDALSADASPWASGMHAFTLTEATGTEPAYLTVTGTGAFIGLPKAFNGGEYAMAPPTTDGSIKYEVLSYVNDGTSEILVLTVDVSEGEVGGAYWTFTLKAD